MNVSKNFYLYIVPAKVAGVDEVGRGPLAGPVVAAAVGLALVILLYRSYGDTRVELASELKS